MSAIPAVHAGRIGEWLSLAASPVFFAMAAASAADPLAALCGGGVGQMSGMTAMYLLMAAFHLPAWLRRAASRSAAP